MMKFTVNPTHVTLDDGEPLTIPIEQWLLLEPDFERDAAAAFEQWTPNLHCKVVEGNQLPANLPDRGGYLVKIDDYRATLGVELPPQPEASLPPDPLGATTVALTPGTPEFELFSWIRQEASSSVLIASARSDLNMNLTMLSNWRRSPVLMAYGLTAAWENLAAAAAAENLTMPLDWEAKVAAWRDTFRLSVPPVPTPPVSE